MKLHWSPSALTTDYLCRMKTFWGRIYAGTGIQPNSPESIEQAFGTVVHEHILNDECITNPIQAHADAYAAMKKKVEELQVVEPLRTEYPILASAVVYAFLTRVLGDMLAKGWRIVELERELEVQQDRVTLITRPDMVMRSPDGILCYFDLKTTSAQPKTFSQGWELSPQLHLGAWAYRQSGSHVIEGVGAMGLHKGTTYQGSLRGPLVVLYHRRDAETNDLKSYRPKYVAKWDRGLITEYPGGIIGWVDDLPDEIIGECFPTSPIIPYDEALVKMLLAQLENRTDDTDIYLENIQALDDPTDEDIDRATEQAFPRNVTSCRNHFGRRCGYWDACWNSVVRKDPVGSGLYVAKEQRDADESATEE